MTTLAEAPLTAIGVNSTLLDAVVKAVEGALDMCGMTARAVGATRVPAQTTGELTGMIGVHGKVSGFVAANFSEKFAISAVEGLLHDSFDRLTSQVIDGAGELTNLIVGGIKSQVARGDWAFGHITVPSVILGQGYTIAYAPGLEFLSVLFERNDPEAVMLKDRLLVVSVSLLRP